MYLPNGDSRDIVECTLISMYRYNINVSINALNIMMLFKIKY